MPTWSPHYNAEGLIQAGDALHAQQMAQRSADRQLKKQREEEQKMQRRMDACSNILSSGNGGMLRKNLVESMKTALGEGKSTVQEFIKKQIEAGQLCIVDGYIQLPSAA